MTESPSTIKAKYELGELVITACSSGLPYWKEFESKPLLTYLTIISARDIEDWYEGWRAVSAFFAGYELTVEMESFEISQAISFPIYLIQKTELSFPEKYGKKLIERLKEPLFQEGWQELATSKQLIGHNGSGTVITLWTKESLSEAKLAESLQS